nr:hypothetical protein [Microvirga arabica]
MRWVVAFRAQEKKCQIRRDSIGRAKVLGWSKAGENAQRVLEAGKHGVRDRNPPPEPER